MTVLKAKSGEIIILTYDSENSYFKGEDIFRDGAGRYYTWACWEKTGAGAKMTECTGFGEKISDDASGVCIFDIF